MWPFSHKKRIYLDHAAATPVVPEVLKEMQPYFSDIYGNPSAIHAEGVRARNAVDDARTRIARILRIRPDDITFTSGGTESNNLALLGSVAAFRKKGLEPSDIEIISTEIEHPSILRVLKELEQEGCIVKYVPVDEDGTVRLADFSAALSKKTKIVTIAYANSETGVVQDLGQIGRTIRSFEKEHDAQIFFHTDASQAPLWLSCALESLHVDMMTLDAGKFCGPKGIGVLVHRPSVHINATIFGGSQEKGFRPGTENVPSIIGFARALELAQVRSKERSEKVAEVREYAIAQLRTIEGLLVNGSETSRLANNINISIPNIDTEFA
ncbi:MAG: cysteine desulfurase family protein, partial [Candidatus Paceibacterota bacterium]